MRKYNEISRRGFLRSAVLAGTGICASSVFNGMVACEGVNRQGPSALDCKTNAVVGVKRTLDAVGLPWSYRLLASVVWD